MSQSFAGMMAGIVDLEGQVALAARQADPLDEPRVYEWRPSSPPELPAIWNWIAPSTYEIIDTARGDDTVNIVVTIGVKPSDLAESMGQLVRLTDHFRAVTGPALNGKGPLGGAVRYARRTETHSAMDEFDGVPVMCMDLLIRCELTAFIG
jgi:hypothetical protein